jgi:hypothetical protein
LESVDNPIWFALTTEHRSLACSYGFARRYLPDVSPLAALLHPTNDAFADLQRLISPGERVALFTASPLNSFTAAEPINPELLSQQSS